jgi:lantibiotic transport system permease protein
MENEEFSRKLQQMHKPQIESATHQMQLKITLLNAKRSAGIGVVMVVIPCLFLLAVLMKYLMNINLSSFSALEEWMADKNHNVLIKMLIPLLLIGAPFIALIFNLLAILHFSFVKKVNELIITVKLKWFNIIVSLICLLILFCFFLYAVGENLGR